MTNKKRLKRRKAVLRSLMGILPVTIGIGIASPFIGNLHTASVAAYDEGWANNVNKLNLLAKLYDYAQETGNTSLLNALKNDFSFNNLTLSTNINNAELLDLLNMNNSNGFAIQIPNEELANPNTVYSFKIGLKNINTEAQSQLPVWAQNELLCLNSTISVNNTSANQPSSTSNNVLMLIPATVYSSIWSTTAPTNSTQVVFTVNSIPYKCYLVTMSVTALQTVQQNYLTTSSYNIVSNNTLELNDIIQLANIANTYTLSANSTNGNDTYGWQPNANSEYIYSPGASADSALTVGVNLGDISINSTTAGELGFLDGLYNNSSYNSWFTNNYLEQLFNDDSSFSGMGGSSVNKTDVQFNAPNYAVYDDSSDDPSINDVGQSIRHSSIGSVTTGSTLNSNGDVSYNIGGQTFSSADTTGQYTNNSYTSGTSYSAGAVSGISGTWNGSTNPGYTYGQWLQGLVSPKGSDYIINGGDTLNGSNEGADNWQTAGYDWYNPVVDTSKQEVYNASSLNAFFTPNNSFHLNYFLWVAMTTVLAAMDAAYVLFETGVGVRIAGNIIYNLGNSLEGAPGFEEIAAGLEAAGEAMRATGAATKREAIEDAALLILGESAVLDKLCHEMYQIYINQIAYGGTYQQVIAAKFAGNDFGTYLQLSANGSLLKYMNSQLKHLNNSKATSNPTSEQVQNIMDQVKSLVKKINTVIPNYVSIVTNAGGDSGAWYYGFEQSALKWADYSLHSYSNDNSLFSSLVPNSTSITNEVLTAFNNDITSNSITPISYITQTQYIYTLNFVGTNADLTQTNTNPYIASYVVGYSYANWQTAVQSGTSSELSTGQIAWNSNLIVNSDPTNNDSLSSFYWADSSNISNGSDLTTNPAITLTPLIYKSDDSSTFPIIASPQTLTYITPSYFNQQLTSLSSKMLNAANSKTKSVAYETTTSYLNNTQSFQTSSTLNIDGFGLLGTNISYNDLTFGTYNNVATLYVTILQQWLQEYSAPIHVINSSSNNSSNSDTSSTSSTSGTSGTTNNDHNPNPNDSVQYGFTSQALTDLSTIVSNYVNTHTTSLQQIYGTNTTSTELTTMLTTALENFINHGLSSAELESTSTNLANLTQNFKNYIIDYLNNSSNLANSTYWITTKANDTTSAVSLWNFLTTLDPQLKTDSSTLSAALKSNTDITNAEAITYLNSLTSSINSTTLYQDLSALMTKVGKSSNVLSSTNSTYLKTDLAQLVQNIAMIYILASYGTTTNHVNWNILFNNLTFSDSYNFLICLQSLSALANIVTSWTTATPTAQTTNDIAQFQQLQSYIESFYIYKQDNYTQTTINITQGNKTISSTQTLKSNINNILGIYDNYLNSNFNIFFGMKYTIPMSNDGTATTTTPDYTFYEPQSQNTTKEQSFQLNNNSSKSPTLSQLKALFANYSSFLQTDTSWEAWLSALASLFENQNGVQGDFNIISTSSSITQILGLTKDYNASSNLPDVYTPTVITSNSSTVSLDAISSSSSSSNTSTSANYLNVFGSSQNWGYSYGEQIQIASTYQVINNKKAKITSLLPTVITGFSSSMSSGLNSTTLLSATNNNTSNSNYINGEVVYIDDSSFASVGQIASFEQPYLTDPYSSGVYSGSNYNADIFNAALSINSISSNNTYDYVTDDTITPPTLKTIVSNGSLHTQQVSNTTATSAIVNANNYLLYNSHSTDPTRVTSNNTYSSYTIDSFPVFFALGSNAPIILDRANGYAEYSPEFINDLENSNKTLKNNLTTDLKALQTNTATGPTVAYLQKMNVDQSSIYNKDYSNALLDFSNADGLLNVSMTLSQNNGTPNSFSAITDNTSDISAITDNTSDTVDTMATTFMDGSSFSMTGLIDTLAGGPSSSLNNVYIYNLGSNTYANWALIHNSLASSLKLTASATNNNTSSSKDFLADINTNLTLQTNTSTLSKFWLDAYNYNNTANFVKVNDASYYSNGQIAQSGFAWCYDNYYQYNNSNVGSISNPINLHEKNGDTFATSATTTFPTTGSTPTAISYWSQANTLFVTGAAGNINSYISSLNKINLNLGTSNTFQNLIGSYSSVLSYDDFFANAINQYLAISKKKGNLHVYSNGNNYLVYSTQNATADWSNGINFVFNSNYMTSSDVSLNGSSNNSSDNNLYPLIAYSPQLSIYDIEKAEVDLYTQTFDNNNISVNINSTLIKNLLDDTKHDNIKSFAWNIYKKVISNSTFYTNGHNTPPSSSIEGLTSQTTNPNPYFNNSTSWNNYVVNALTSLYAHNRIVVGSLTNKANTGWFTTNKKATNSTISFNLNGDALSLFTSPQYTYYAPTVNTTLNKDIESFLTLNHITDQSYSNQLYALLNMFNDSTSKPFITTLIEGKVLFNKLFNDKLANNVNEINSLLTTSFNINLYYTTGIYNPYYNLTSTDSQASGEDSDSITPSMLSSKWVDNYLLGTNDSYINVNDSNIIGTSNNTNNLIQSYFNNGYGYNVIDRSTNLPYTNSSTYNISTSYLNPKYNPYGTLGLFNLDSSSIFSDTASDTWTTNTVATKNYSYIFQVLSSDSFTLSNLISYKNAPVTSNDITNNTLSTINNLISAMANINSTSSYLPLSLVQNTDTEITSATNASTLVNNTQSEFNTEIDTLLSNGYLSLPKNMTDKPTSSQVSVPFNYGNLIIALNAFLEYLNAQLQTDTKTSSITLTNNLGNTAQYTVFDDTNKAINNTSVINTAIATYPLLASYIAQMIASYNPALALIQANKLTDISSGSNSALNPIIQELIANIIGEEVKNQDILTLTTLQVSGINENADFDNKLETTSVNSRITTAINNKTNLAVNGSQTTFKYVYNQLLLPINYDYAGISYKNPFSSETNPLRAPTKPTFVLNPSLSQYERNIRSTYDNLKTELNLNNVSYPSWWNFDNNYTLRQVISNTKTGSNTNNTSNSMYYMNYSNNAITTQTGPDSFYNTAFSTLNFAFSALGNTGTAYKNAYENANSKDVSYTTNWLLPSVLQLFADAKATFNDDPTTLTYNTDTLNADLSTFLSLVTQNSTNSTTWETISNDVTTLVQDNSVLGWLTAHDEIIPAANSWFLVNQVINSKVGGTWSVAKTANTANNSDDTTTNLSVPNLTLSTNYGTVVGANTTAAITESFIPDSKDNASFGAYINAYDPQILTLANINLTASAWNNTNDTNPSGYLLAARQLSNFVSRTLWSMMYQQSSSDLYPLPLDLQGVPVAKVLSAIPLLALNAVLQNPELENAALNTINNTYLTTNTYADVLIQNSLIIILKDLFDYALINSSLNTANSTYLQTLLINGNGTWNSTNNAFDPLYNTVKISNSSTTSTKLTQADALKQLLASGTYNNLYGAGNIPKLTNSTNTAYNINNFYDAMSAWYSNIDPFMNLYNLSFSTIFGSNKTSNDITYPTLSNNVTGNDITTAYQTYESALKSGSNTATAWNTLYSDVQDYETNSFTLVPAYYVEQGANSTVYEDYLVNDVVAKASYSNETNVSSPLQFINMTNAYNMGTSAQTYDVQYTITGKVNTLSWNTSSIDGITSIGDLIAPYSTSGADYGASAANNGIINNSNIDLTGLSWYALDDDFPSNKNINLASLGDVDSNVQNYFTYSDLSSLIGNLIINYTPNGTSSNNGLLFNLANTANYGNLITINSYVLNNGTINSLSSNNAQNEWNDVAGGASLINSTAYTISKNNDNFTLTPNDTKDATSNAPYSINLIYNPETSNVGIYIGVNNAINLLNSNIYNAGHGNSLNEIFAYFDNNIAPIITSLQQYLAPSSSVNNSFYDSLPTSSSSYVGIGVLNLNPYSNGVINPNMKFIFSNILSSDTFDANKQTASNVIAQLNNMFNSNLNGSSDFSASINDPGQFAITQYNSTNKAYYGYYSITANTNSMFYMQLKDFYNAMQANSSNLNSTTNTATLLTANTYEDTANNFLNGAYSKITYNYDADFAYTATLLPNEWTVIKTSNGSYAIIWNLINYTLPLNSSSVNGTSSSLSNNNSIYAVFILIPLIVLAVLGLWYYKKKKPVSKKVADIDMLSSASAISGTGIGQSVKANNETLDINTKDNTTFTNNIDDVYANNQVANKTFNKFNQPNKQEHKKKHHKAHETIDEEWS